MYVYMYSFDLKQIASIYLDVIHELSVLASV